MLEGVAGQIDQFDGKLWATARYLFNWSEDETADLNRDFNRAFQERWGRFPNYSAECTYAAVQSIRQACEEAGSTDTAEVIEALSGMSIETPAGTRRYREEDHQAVYTVPAGRVVLTDDYPLPVVGEDLFIEDPETYYRWPPFEPIEY